jgi:hypothetical protein
MVTWLEMVGPFKKLYRKDMVRVKQKEKSLKRFHSTWLLGVRIGNQGCSLRSWIWIMKESIGEFHMGLSMEQMVNQMHKLNFGLL